MEFASRSRKTERNRSLLKSPPTPNELPNKNLPFIHEEWESDKAIEFFQARGETFKVELIKDLAQAKVSIYKHGDFVDLCKGPHLGSTKEAKYFKILSISG